MRLRTAEQAGRAAARAGFTLMELLVVVAILIVLASVATPLYLSYLEQTREKTARTSAINFAAEIQNWMALNPVPEGTQNFFPPTINPNPPMDPWERPYQSVIFRDEFSGAMVAVVWSTGPAGAFDHTVPFSSANK
jgi:prepilin-type N-terminal cleavage/methylation domain-containing protein